MGSTLRLGRTLFPRTHWYRCLEGLALGTLTLGLRLIKLYNLPYQSNTEWGCWYPASSFNRPLHTFLTQYQKDQHSGSVQDQVIRAPGNCKAIPEQLLLSLEWSELSVLVYTAAARAKRNSRGLHLFLSSKGKDCTSVEVFVQCAWGESENKKLNLLYVANHRPEANWWKNSNIFE